MDESSPNTYDPEVIHPPRPGGMVDMARKAAARETAQAHQAAAEQEAAASVQVMNPVTVKVREPDEWGARSVMLFPGQSMMALPGDRYRKRALINLAEVSGAVLIAKDRSAADSGTGYLLMAGQEPVSLGHSREVWIAAAPDALDAVTVSIFSESYCKE